MGVPHVATIPTVEVERILRCKAEGDLVRKPLAQITNNPTDRSMLQALIGQHLTGNPEDGRWDGESYGYFTTSNPEGRWDWHLVGGGWCGFYILHSGIEKDAFLLGEDNKLSPTPYGAMAGRADVARKGAIDFEGTRFRAGALQENRHDCYSEATQGIEAPEPWGHVLAQMVQGAVAQKSAAVAPEGSSADTMLDSASRNFPALPGPIDSLSECEAAKWAQDTLRYMKVTMPPTFSKVEGEIINRRQEYNEHPWIVALRENQLLPIFDSPHEVFKVGLGGREAMVKERRDGALVTHSLLTDDGWLEQGRVGAFGSSDDTMSVEAWREMFNEIIDGVPDDAWLVLVDVHC